MSNYIFFKSFLDKTIVPPMQNLQILPCQKVVTPTGTEYDADRQWRVAVQDKSILGSYPLGTAFAVESSNVIVQPGRCLYSISGKNYNPVSALPKVTDHIPSRDAVAAFDIYTSKYPDWNAESGSLFDEESKSAAAPAPAPAPSAAAPARKTVKTVFQQINDKYPAPSVQKDSFSCPPRAWQVLVRNAAFRKRPTLITGPTGSGKTELVMLLGKMLGLPVHIYDMGSMHDPKAQLIGMQALASGAMGSITKFQYAQFTRDIQQPGIILLDELNRAPGTANNILMPLLDSRRRMYVEEAGEGEQREIACHPDCVFLATANLGSIYTATELMDEAFKDRLNVIALDYLDRSTETDLLVKRTGISRKIADAIADVCASVRQKYAENKLSRPLSTRESILAAEYVEDGWDAKSAMEIAFLNLFDGEGGTTSEQNTVKSLILSK